MGTELMKAFIWVITILSFLPTDALARDKKSVTLVVYVDLSRSMENRREAVGELAEVITSQLGQACGEFEIGVSNLVYHQVPGSGELIGEGGGTAFINEKTKEAARIIRQRLTVKYKDYYQKRQAFYKEGPSELTFSSVARTLSSHLLAAPRFTTRNGRKLVATLLITDAAPSWEDGPPSLAISKIEHNLGGVDFIAGALGAGAEECMDTTPGNNRPLDPHALEEFTRLSGGYHWGICRADKKGLQRIKESVLDFLRIVIDRASCQLLV